jgi:hypothetical protein
MQMRHATKWQRSASARTEDLLARGRELERERQRVARDDFLAHAVRAPTLLLTQVCVFGEMDGWLDGGMEVYVCVCVCARHTHTHTHTHITFT